MPRKPGISAQLVIKAMVNHLKQIAHRPMRDWEQAFVEAASATSLGRSRSAIFKEEQERRIQEGFERLSIRINDPTTDRPMKTIPSALLTSKLTTWSSCRRT